MYKIIDFADFRIAFWRLGRGNPFSNAGLRALFEHLEDDCVGRRGPELDVNAICRTWVEYYTATEAAEANGWDVEEDGEDTALEWLRYETDVIPFDGGVLAASF